IIGVNKFSAVITDTASVMKAAWKIIEKNHSNIVCLGCNSHIMNLLIGDILKIDQIKFIMENAKKLVNYFKAHVQAAAKLKRIQKENYNKEIALVLLYQHLLDGKHILLVFNHFKNQRQHLNK